MLSASNKVSEQVLDDALKDFERVRSMSSASNKVSEQVLDDALKDFEQDGGRKNHRKNKTKRTIIGKSNKIQHCCNILLSNYIFILESIILLIIRRAN